MLTYQTFKDLLHKEIGTTLTVNEVRPISLLGGGTLSVGVYADGRVEVHFNGLGGGYRQYSFKNYEEVKQRTSTLEFTKEVVLTALQAFETIELKAAKGGGFAVPVSYSVTFRILSDNRVTWEVR